MTKSAGHNGIAAAFVLACASALFALTMSVTPFPGGFSDLVGQYTGIDPFDPLSHPLWRTLVALVSAIPAGALTLRLGVLSAACSFVSVYLVFGITSGLLSGRGLPPVDGRPSTSGAQGLAGVVAGLLLATSVPFWIVSTRAHPASFDIMLLLLSWRLLIWFGQAQRPILLFAAVALYGLTMAEFATAILQAPLFGLAVLIFMWRAGQLRLAQILKTVLCGSVGVLPYFALALWFERQPSFAWREFMGFSQVLKFIALDQYWLIAGGLPKVGWLAVLLVTFVPLLIVLLLSLRAARPEKREGRVGTYLVHGVVTLICLLVMFNFRIAPWPMAGLSPLLVTPYVCYAICSGYLAGWWYLVLSREARFESPMFRSVKRAGRVALIPVILAALVVSAYLNYQVADGRSARWVHQFVELVLDAVKDKQWLITNGSFDSQLAIQARERGQSLTLLNLSHRVEKTLYGRYLETLMPNDNLKSLARLGVGPLVSAMLANLDLAGRTAILSTPDVWLTAGLEPIPWGVVYVGAASGSATNPGAIREANQAVWTQLADRMLHDRAHPRNLAAPWDAWILQHVSKSANNYGVYLEDVGDTNAAVAAYQAALRYNTNNASALINLHALAVRIDAPEAASLESQLRDLVEDRGSRFEAWSLAAQCGYVRYPERYVNRGMVWAISGKPNMAVADLRKALELNPDRPDILSLLGKVYLTGNLTTESEEVYRELLQKNPNDKVALLGLARVDITRGQMNSALEKLQLLEDLKAPADVVLSERAVIASLSGDLKRAKELFLKVVAGHDENMEAWGALALLGHQTSDEETLARARDRILASRTAPFHVRIALGRIFQERRDGEMARKFLESARRLQPTSVPALEMLLNLDTYEGKRDLAEKHVEQLLTVDPGNALANYVLGSFYIQQNQFALAESAFRKSLETRRNPGVLNDLAWILTQKNQLEEALVLAREAVQIDANSPIFWDTLGQVNIELGHLDEAQEAIQKALSLRPDFAPCLLSMARVYEKKGMIEEARRLIDNLMNRPSELAPDDYSAVREIAERVRQPG